MGFGTQNEGPIVDGRRGHAAVVERVRGEHFKSASRFEDGRFAILVAEVDATIAIDG